MSKVFAVMAIIGCFGLGLLIAGIIIATDNGPAAPVPMFAVTHVDVSNGGFPNIVACVTYTRDAGVAIDCDWGNR